MSTFQFVVTVTEREPLQLDTNQAIQQVMEQLLEDSAFDPDTIQVNLLSAGLENASNAIATMVNKWIERGNLPTTSTQGVQLFNQTIQDVIQQHLTVGFVPEVDPEIADANKSHGQLKGVYDGVTSEQLLSWLEPGLAEEFELNIESELTWRGICHICGQLLATHNDDGPCVQD